MKPTDPVADRPMIDNTPPDVPVRDYRPVERFWPYVDLPEQPTDEELASLNPGAFRGTLRHAEAAVFHLD